MTIVIKKVENKKGLRSRIEELSGVDLSLCYQCKKCANGCPVAGQAKTTPAEIIRRLQLGAGEELLVNNMVWLCLSCETCYNRCPMKINAAAVIDALREIAVEKGVAKPKGNVPLFNKAFLTTVKMFGRSYDLPALAVYKLGSGSLTGDMEKVPTMLKKGKLAITPPTGADNETVKRIFDNIRTKKGTVK
jgi:heterodisulfide reductase subunit C2